MFWLLKKSLVSVIKIKSKIAHNIFATKSTDQKNDVLKKPLKNACINMRHTLIFG